MSWIELRENRQRVREALKKGYVDEVVACRATAFDELEGAMNAFGYWEQLEELEIDLEKDEDDVPNELLLRELAVLPLLRIPNPHQAPMYLFQDPGVLRFLGFTLAEIREGFNSKGVRSPTGKARMRPHHYDTLYNALKAVVIESVTNFRVAHRAGLVKHGGLEGGYLRAGWDRIAAQRLSCGDPPTSGHRGALYRRLARARAGAGTSGGTGDGA